MFYPSTCDSVKKEEEEEEEEAKKEKTAARLVSRMAVNQADNEVASCTGARVMTEDNCTGNEYSQRSEM